MNASHTEKMELLFSKAIGQLSNEKNLKSILPCYCNINMKFMKQTF